MKNRLVSTIIISFCFVASYAQSQCDALLDAARGYKKQGAYEMAIEKYNRLEQKCPNYFTETVKKERSSCEEKLRSQNKTKQQKTSEYLPTQQLSTGLSNREFYFDGDGKCENTTNRLELYWNDWNFLVNEDYQDWLKVERQGNSLLVTCRPNDDMRERKGEITIYGEINTTIKVYQDKRKASPKSRTRTNYTEQSDSTVETKEEQQIIVKITFEKGKAKPKFDNNVGRLITALVENNNLGLQIEVYKCENQSGLKNLIKAPLIDKRFKEITEHFVNLGIDNYRISKNIIVIDGDKSSAECDCAYAKNMNQATEGRIKVEVPSGRTEEATNAREKTAITDISDALTPTKIFFDQDKDIPKIEDSNDNISKTVQILKNNPNLKLIVEGYTSDFGSEQHNRDLAQRRANNVRKLFIEKGVDPNQIETASYTVNDPQNRQNIPDPSRKAHDCAIFRIVKR